MHRFEFKLLPLVCLFSLFATSANAQPTELFFSEYVEGSSFNKALEIYNGTAEPIDLAAGGYRIEMFSNGNTTSSVAFNLTGVIAAGDAFVVTQSAASQTLRDLADFVHSSSSWFNGDDAIVLRKGGVGGPIVDVIGQIGHDPGSEWGSGLASTA